MSASNSHGPERIAVTHKCPTCYAYPNEWCWTMYPCSPRRTGRLHVARIRRGEARGVNPGGVL